MAQTLEKVKFNSTNVRNKSWRRTAVHLKFRMLGRIAPQRTRHAIMRRFFTPSAYVTTPLEKQALQRGRPFLLRVHDNSIHGWQWGHGPRILFVHGWNGRGIQFLPFFESVVASGWAAIAVDGPAHGDSMGQTTNYFEFTDMVRRIIARKGGFDIRGIVAHSLGASAVINALVHEGADIDAVLIAPALRLKEIMFNTFSRYGVPRHFLASIFGQLEMRFGYRLDRDNPIQGAAQVRSRLLVVHDRDDKVVPFTDSKGLAAASPSIRLYATRGLGHRRILSDPDVVQYAVRFLIGDRRQAAVAPGRG